MSKFVKVLLIALAANIGTAALLCLPLLFAKGEDGLGWMLLAFFGMCLALLVQLIVGIVFAAGATRRETGKGLLVAVGILLLIGLSVCGGGLILG
jgi:hypothetical protein